MENKERIDKLQEKIDRLNQNEVIEDYKEKVNNHPLLKDKVILIDHPEYFFYRIMTILFFLSTVGIIIFLYFFVKNGLDGLVQNNVNPEFYSQLNNTFNNNYSIPLDNNINNNYQNNYTINNYNNITILVNSS